MPNLEIALVSHYGGAGVASVDDLDRGWSMWFPDTYTSRRGREVFLRALHRLGNPADPDSELGFRLGGWEIDLGKTAVQAGLVSAFLGGALAILGVDHVPVEVLPAVMPLVFDVRRSRLTASQEYILAELLLQDEVRDLAQPADALYAKLPTATRDEMPRAEFEDFVDALRRAGVADRDGDAVTLTSPDKARFRITLK